MPDAFAVSGANRGSRRFGMTTAAAAMWRMFRLRPPEKEGGNCDHHGPATLAVLVLSPACQSNDGFNWLAVTDGFDDEEDGDLQSDVPSSDALDCVRY